MRAPRALSQQSRAEPVVAQPTTDQAELQPAPLEIFATQSGAKLTFHTGSTSALYGYAAPGDTVYGRLTQPNPAGYLARNPFGRGSQ
jgi:hypothetical protein